MKITIESGLPKVEVKNLTPGDIVDLHIGTSCKYIFIGITSTENYKRVAIFSRLGHLFNEPVFSIAKEPNLDKLATVVGRLKYED